MKGCPRRAGSGRDVLMCQSTSSEFERLSAAQSDRALVGGLAAPAGVKAGLIEGDGLLPDRDNVRVAFKAVAVLQVETLGGRGWQGRAVAAGLKCLHTSRGRCRDVPGGQHLGQLADRGDNAPGPSEVIRVREEMVHLTQLMSVPGGRCGVKTDMYCRFSSGARVSWMMPRGQT